MIGQLGINNGKDLIYQGEALVNTIHGASDISRTLVGDETVEGGESWDEFRARTDAALDALAGNGVLLVGHAGTWRVISARLGLPVDADAVRNATPIRVMPRGRRPAWLPLAG